jgi:hypothetical protein
MRTTLLLLGSAFAASAWAADYDANGVKLGATEKDIKRGFPTAYCKPLEWTTPAADRRCDDAKASLGGTQVRVTFYLKKDAVQGFDVRFETRDVQAIAGMLKKRYGEPAAETRDAFTGKEGKEIYKVVWESGKDRATLVSQVDKKRGQLTVARGNFEEEIYKVR